MCKFVECVSGYYDDADWSDCFASEHRRGVAGGGWEDEEDHGHDAAINFQYTNLTFDSNCASMENDRLTTSEMSLLQVLM